MKIRRSSVKRHLIGNYKKLMREKRPDLCEQIGEEKLDELAKRFINSEKGEVLIQNFIQKVKEAEANG